MKQPRILDGQHGLRGKGLDQIDRVLRKCTGRAAADNKQSDDFLTTHQRCHQKGAETSARDDVVYCRRSPLAQISHLDRLTLGKDFNDVWLIKPNMLFLERLN